MPAPLLSRDEVEARLLEVFRTKGYDGASIADLSEATGLGRSSLYHYFPGGKEEMAKVMLARAGAWLQESVVRPLTSPGTPQERLATMIRNLDAFYEHGCKACLLGNLVVGPSRSLFQGELREAFRTWIEALASLAKEAGAQPKEAAKRAERAVLGIQGALILSAGLDDPAPFRRFLKDLPGELLAGHAMKD